ncbi:MAG: hypothetical protein CO001_00825, partial [Candidatus Portnoybacteria bacterium CG_4_8_14_3_um_filter_40_10]
NRLSDYGETAVDESLADFHFFGGFVGRKFIDKPIKQFIPLFGTDLTFKQIRLGLEGKSEAAAAALKAAIAEP